MSNVIKLTKKHEINLRKLAAGLRSEARKMYNFDMVDFDQDYPWGETSPFHCGSVGCAVGHATRLVSPRNSGEHWSEFSDRLFGPLRGRKWDWCFDGGWRSVDNSPAAAASRIDYLLDHGLPDDLEDDPDEHQRRYYRTPKLYVSPQTAAMFPA